MTAVNDGEAARAGDPPATRRRLVPALARGLALLETVAEAPGPCSAPDLARRTGLPRTTVHDLVQTLLFLGYLRESEEGQHCFALGPRVLTLGHGYLADLDFVREAETVVRQVSEATGETVQVAVLDGTDVLYVAKAESSSAVRLVSAVGRRLPAHLTGVGKALLAHLPEAELDRLYTGEQLQRMTEHSIGSVTCLRRQLDEVRASGYSHDWCESNTEVACVATAILDRSGRAVAAISISAPASRFSDEYRAGLTSRLRVGADDLMASLGRRPG